MSEEEKRRVTAQAAQAENNAIVPTKETAAEKMKEEKTLHIRRPLLWAGLLVGIVLLNLLLGYPLWGSWPLSTVPDHFAVLLQADGRIELNHADAAALCALPGIGEGRAAAILEWREENGGFDSVDELAEIPGIGEKILEALRPYVFVEEKAEKQENGG